MKNNQCPYCGKKINYIRKILFFSSIYVKECPYCKRRIKIKSLGYKVGVGILIIIISIMVLFRENSFIMKVLPISYIAFALIGLYFLKYYPSEE